MGPNDYDMNGLPWHLSFRLAGVSGSPTTLVVPDASVQHAAGIEPPRHIAGYGLVITNFSFSMYGTAGNGFRIQARDYGFSPPGSDTYALFEAQCASATALTQYSWTGFLPLRVGRRIGANVINGSAIEIVQITGAPTGGYVQLSGFHTMRDFGRPPALPTPGSPNVIF